MGVVPKRATLGAAGVLIALGLPGVFATLLVTPEIPGVPRLALLVNPLLLLCVAALVGAAVAPRVGLRSALAEWLVRGHPLPPATHWMMPLLLGVAVGLGVAALDALATPFWRGAAAAPLNVLEGWSPAGLLAGLLYGGVTEEIIMRWGLMSLLVWLFSGLPSHVRQAPAGAAWAGIAGAALLFGLAHLPALSLAGAEFSSGVVGRTVLLNAVIGLALGWLFVRRDLESAMLAHAGVHVGFALLALVAAGR